MQCNATRCNTSKNGLKIRRGQPRGGSTPPPGTMILNGFIGLLQRLSWTFDIATKWFEGAAASGLRGQVIDETRGEGDCGEGGVGVAGGREDSGSGDVEVLRTEDTQILIHHPFLG